MLCEPSMNYFTPQLYQQFNSFDEGEAGFRVWRARLQTGWLELWSRALVGRDRAAPEMGHPCM